MASVVGLLDERKPAARERVEGLRKEADRVLAELAEAETHWRERLIARQRVGEVLSASRPGRTGGGRPGTGRGALRAGAGARPGHGRRGAGGAGGFGRRGVAARAVGGSSSTVSARPGSRSVRTPT